MTRPSVLGERADRVVPWTVEQSLTMRVNTTLMSEAFHNETASGEGSSMKALAEQIAELDRAEIYGRVVGVRGLMIEAAGPLQAMSIGARVTVEVPDRMIACEVVGFSGPNALLMPFAALDGVRRGCRAVVTSAASAVRPSIGWLGRVINAMGEPIDGKGPLPLGSAPAAFRHAPPPAHARRLGG